MARKRNTTDDYSQMTSAEIQAGIEKLKEVVAKTVAHKRLEYDDLLALMVNMGPRGAAKLCDDVFAMAAALMADDDPTAAPPLRPGDAGAIADDVAAWLAGDGA